MNLYHLSEQDLNRYAELEVLHGKGLTLSAEEWSFVTTVGKYIEDHPWPEETPIEHEERKERVAHFRRVVANLPS